MIGRHLDRLYPERDRHRHRARGARGRATSPAAAARAASSFDLREGEVLGVGGLQGHGQRELFQALFGAAPRDRQRRALGQAGRASPARAQALTGRDGIALVPEDRRGQGLLLTKSVRENLTLAVIRRFSERGLLDRAREAALVARDGRLPAHQGRDARSSSPARCPAATSRR